MTKINDNTELKIIEFLKENGPSFMGEVIKGLKLSNTTGLKHTNNLVSQGIIKQTFRPLQYQLNTESE